ncbi:RND transporter [Bradyrhizobium sp. CSA207]|nr:RND transporter [Bradyrhizobium sp. CSA207]
MERTMKPIIRMTAALTLALGLTAGAPAQAASVNGEVKKIDEGAGKITLKHGPAKNLGMDEPMTMVYRVKDPAVLKQVKVGDKVTFEAEEAAAGYTVTKIEKAK